MKNFIDWHKSTEILYNSLLKIQKNKDSFFYIDPKEKIYIDILTDMQQKDGEFFLRYNQFYLLKNGKKRYFISTQDSETGRVLGLTPISKSLKHISKEFDLK